MTQTMEQSTVRACARCGKVRRIKARGLHADCYEVERRAGRLDNWPRIPRPVQADRWGRTCARCGAAREIKGRRLCEPCNEEVWATGEVDNWPRVNTPLSFVVYEYLFLGKVEPFREIARRMGLSASAAERAYWRAIQRGLIEKEPYAPAGESRKRWAA